MVSDNFAGTNGHVAGNYTDVLILALGEFNEDFEVMLKQAAISTKLYVSGLREKVAILQDMVSLKIQ